MPSDPRIETALRALAVPIERYRSTVVSTVEDVRGYLATHRPSREPGDGSVAAGLGEFAVGRIDFGRYAKLLSDSGPEDPERLRKVEKAFDILRVIAAGGDDLFQISVKPGERLRDAVAQRCSEIGRAFAAARVAGMATSGRLNANGAERLFEPLSFERWNDAERKLAPPLVVEVDGADLRAAELAEFLDGNVKLVLVVRGAMTPAPLVRLITPSTFVLQTADDTGLDRFSAFTGPAVAALVSEGAARFIHDPAGGAEPSRRLELFYVPETAPKQRLGGMSARQQQDELDMLVAMAAAAPVVPGTAAASASAARQAADAVAPAAAADEDPVNKLAAWLLSQADLTQLE